MGQAYEQHTESENNSQEEKKGKDGTTKSPPDLI